MVGVVARATVEGKIILAYFFGPQRTGVPALREVELLKPRDAIRIVRVGDLSIIRGEWPIIGDASSWKRSDWPMPPFARRDHLSRKAWRVQYSDADPNLIDHEEPVSFETNLERDAVFGSGAAELLLTKVLT